MLEDFEEQLQDPALLERLLTYLENVTPRNDSLNYYVKILIEKELEDKLDHSITDLESLLHIMIKKAHICWKTLTDIRDNVRNDGQDQCLECVKEVDADKIVEAFGSVFGPSTLWPQINGLIADALVNATVSLKSLKEGNEEAQLYIQRLNCGINLLNGIIAFAQ